MTGLQQKVRTCLWFDGNAAARAREAMLTMRKIDIAALEAAFSG